MRITNESIEKYFSTGNNGEDLMNGKCKNCEDMSITINSHYDEAYPYCTNNGRLINPKTFNPPTGDCPKEDVE